MVYGVKSSPDEKGAVADQHRQIIEAIERASGSEVIGTFGEENESGYGKSRGPELERAMQTAIDAATGDGEAELWVWHPSRLARGTGKKGEAQSLMERLTYLRRHGVTVRAVDRGDMIANPLLWGIEDEQQSAYSQNLGTWVRAGLARRKAAGKPVGAMPFGWTVEKEIVDGNVISRRVVDPQTGPIRVQMLERVAGGATPGSVARWLNRKGIKTRRGQQFTRRAVSQIVESAANDGGGGYPALVSAELAQAARDGLRRLDPAAVQDRTVGRPARDESYILRGVVFCASCGSPLRPTRNYLGGQRSYACRDKLESRGICQRRPIPADLLETHVLEHLACFVDSVDGWLGGLVMERDGQRKVREDQLDTERAAMSALDRQRDERMAELESIGVTKIGMEVIERIDAKSDGQRQRVVDAEAVLAEWAPPPNLNAALDYYSELLDLVQGRVQKAQGAKELNEALASVLTGLWCEIRGGRLHVEFELQEQPDVVVPDDPVLQHARPDRDWLPPVEITSQPALMESAKTAPKPHRSHRCTV